MGMYLGLIHGAAGGEPAYVCAQPLVNEPCPLDDVAPMRAALPQGTWARARKTVEFAGQGVASRMFPMDGQARPLLDV